MREFITGQSLIVFGLAVVVFVFLMRRTFLRGGLTGSRFQKSAANSDGASDGESPEMIAELLEVRLFDFAREVEGRMQTRIAVLDRLIVDADREILRLQDLLAATDGGSSRTRQPDAVVGLNPPDGEHKEA